MINHPPPDLTRFLAESRQKAITWANHVLNDERAIILDTETTGLHRAAEIIEITIIKAASGQVVLDTLVKPRGPIPHSATAIHGLTAAKVTSAPIWPDIHRRVGEILRAASYVVIYNVEFDLRLLRQTRDQYGLPPVGPEQRRYHCAMQHYARFMGQWDRTRNDFKFLPLPSGNHRALGDCQATQTLLKRMAAGKS